MGDGKILDIAHISFLDMIKVMISMTGAANAKGTLIRNALSTAGNMSEVGYDSFDEYVAAIEDVTNPITMVEGKASHRGEYVFGLPQCPFGPSIKNYTEVFEKLPEGYADFTDEFNKSSGVTTKYRAGEGAGVSPFCAVHQPMRSAIAERITIDGKKVEIYQLGCKSGAGKKGFADKWIAEAGVSADLVDRVLDDHMCCYVLKIVG
jgi:hypothetical protein